MKLLKNESLNRGVFIEEIEKFIKGFFTNTPGPDSIIGGSFKTFKDQIFQCFEIVSRYRGKKKKKKKEKLPNSFYEASIILTPRVYT